MPIALVLYATVQAQIETGIKGNFVVQQETSTAALLNINKIAMWANDNGITEKNTLRQTAGVTFPRGTSTLVYDGGILWGGYVRDGASPALRVGGQARVAGTIPGRITSSRLPENRYGTAVRVFRIRRDWKTADLRQDASETFGISIYDVTDVEISELRKRYTIDWLTWPWQKGAPYYERNGIPGYQADTSGVPDSAKDEPGLLNASQVVWLVCNDLSPSATQQVTGSSPIGIEHQITCWAYSGNTQLENVIYQRHRIIYKGMPTTPPNSRIDSMFIAKWADTDVGDVRDDYSAVMVDKNLAYTYNATEIDFEYDKFNLLPPIIGFDLLQGPRVSKIGGTARWNFTDIDGYENLQMTSFVALVDSERIDQPVGVQRWWNVLRGFKSAPASPPECFRDPFSNECTKFPLSGDPRTIQGWVDGRVARAGDRRIIMSSGPFEMALGDTQEVIIALIASEGNDRVSRINKLDSIDVAAQDYYNRNFQAMSAIPRPNLRVVELDKKLILDWETDYNTMQAVENYNSYGYKFETYKIYQYKSPSVGSEYKLLPPFDPSAPRLLYITTDMVRNRPLVNGQKYYFAVTAVMTNSHNTGGSQRIETEPEIKTIIPHSPNPGVVYPYDIGDTVSNVINIVGYNDAPVNVSVFDPSKTTGDSLKILFHFPVNSRVKATWDCIITRTGDTVLKRIVVDSPPQRIISQGINVQVGMQLFGLKGVFQTMYKGEVTNDRVFNIPNPGKNFMVLADGSSQLDSIHGASAVDKDIELRFTGDSSWAFLRRATWATSRWVRVPYTAWQMEHDESNRVGRQVYTVIKKQGQDSMWRPTVLLDREYNGKPMQVFYPITVVVDPYCNPICINDRYIDDLTHPYIPSIGGYLHNVTNTNASKTGLYEVYLADLDEDGEAAPLGTIIRFKRYKDIREGDQKLIIPSSIRENDKQATRTEVEKINVFPNPYYGVNRAETNKMERFVTFNHLPYTAVIRIFNLAGILTKTIEKHDASQFATWDLSNENNLPVGSGLYIAYLELKDAGGIGLGSKTLKLMIVQEERFR